MIKIKSVLNKDKNHYYYKIFLEECSHQLVENTSHDVIINQLFFFIFVATIRDLQ